MQGCKSMYPPWGDEHLMGRGRKGPSGGSDVGRKMVGPLAVCLSAGGRDPALRPARVLSEEGAKSVEGFR